MATLASTMRPEQRGDDLRRRLLEPLPRLRARWLLLALLGILVYAWGVAGTKVSPAEFVRGFPYLLDFLRRQVPPQWKTEPLPLATAPLALPFGWQIPSLGFAGVVIPLPEIVPAILETLQMAIIGTTGAIILALPFGLLAARNTSPHRLVYQGTRLLLNANRAIPDLIFALIFVAAVGLGPFGGVMALAVGAIGSLGKVYAEAIEAIDPQQVQAVSATGANRFQTFVYGVIPQALPLIASYSILHFEHNVRSATVLGIVGAGGVGLLLERYMALFQYQNLLGALVFLVVVVTLIDRASDALRRRII
jgi:phosphonate transport system permease protein